MAKTYEIDQFLTLRNLTCCPTCRDACGCSAICPSDNCDYCNSCIINPPCPDINFTDCTKPSCDNTDWHI